DDPDGTGGGVGTRTRTATGTAAGTATSSRTGLLVLSWTVVGIPLAYGVVQTLVRAAGLFGG
ncbi:MAG: hypothetical protein WB441_11340, partial [Nocardioidaceae bacterium]